MVHIINGEISGVGYTCVWVYAWPTPKKQKELNEKTKLTVT